MNTRLHTSLSNLSSSAVMTAALLFLPNLAGAQAPANQTIQWGSGLSPVTLGAGVAISPSQIAVLNSGVDPTTYQWVNKQTSLDLLDYANTTDTVSKLRINAWAEYDGWISSGKFSFDYSNYQAYSGNTRNWEVDINRLWTAKIPAPNLTPTAITYQAYPTTFEGLYGNYAVTGITYRRRIKILFSQTFTRTVSDTQWSAAIQGSYGCISGGVSAAQEISNLQSIGQTSITIEVDGANGSQTIAYGVAANLPQLQQAVVNQLQQWDNQPTSTAPSDAGNVDSVNLTTYKAVTPQVIVVPQRSPDQIVLNNALSSLIRLLLAKQRIEDIQGDTNLNPTLSAYLFGGTDSNGKLRQGKLAEVSADVVAQTAYYKSVHNHDGLVSDPKIHFSFQDPDVVQWRVLEYPAGNAYQYYPIIEIYSNARVKAFAPLTGGAMSSPDHWTAGLRSISTSGGPFTALAPPLISANSSYTTNLDPVTGIPHRYQALQWTAPSRSGGPMTIILVSESDQTQIYTNAIDWTGLPTPEMIIDPTSWRRTDSIDPSGRLGSRIIGELP